MAVVLAVLVVLTLTLTPALDLTLMMRMMEVGRVVQACRHFLGPARRPMPSPPTANRTHSRSLHISRVTSCSSPC